jgi:TrmH family RNA methyltransferase
VGTLLRSAAAFGAGAVLATPGTAHFFNPKVVRAAAGSTFKLRLCEGVTAQNLGSLLKRSGSRLIIADSRAGVAPGALDRFNCILALGHETSGVSAALRELAAQVVRIPMAEATESLNVAVAGSIILYEISKRKASNADFGMRNAE